VCSHFVLQTWPEQWQGSTDAGLSLMHGCYNSIGLWFIHGIAGIDVDAGDPKYPLRIRAGVDSGDITWANGTRFALTGEARSAWSLAPTLSPVSPVGGNRAISDAVEGANSDTLAAPTIAAPPFTHGVVVPANVMARVMIPAMAAQGDDVTEGGASVRGGGVSGVQVLGMETVNGISFLSMAVGSGSYNFASRWSRT
jgi:hypothetical protein